MPDSRSRRYGVRKRGTKWVARPYLNGEHHWVGTFETEDEALRAAMKRHDQLKRGPVSQETVDAFVKRWLDDYPRPKESTNDHYRHMAKLFAADHGDKKLAEFGRLDARRFARKHGGAARAIRTMFSDAMDEGLVEVNPFASLKLPNEGGRKGGRRDIVVLTAEELALLEEVAREADDDYRFDLFIRFAAYTGMRPSEIYGVEHLDVDYEREEIRVNRQIHKGRCTLPKNGKQRTIVLPPQAAEALREIRPYSPIRMADERGKERPVNLVFRNKSGNALSATSVHFYWSPVRMTFEAQLSPERRAELCAARNPKHPEMALYELRHFCATYLLEMFRAGGQEGSADVARQLGHTDEGELVRTLYAHPSDDLARERIKRLWSANVEPLRPVRGDEEVANG